MSLPRAPSTILKSLPRLTPSRPLLASRSRILSPQTPLSASTSSRALLGAGRRFQSTSAGGAEEAKAAEGEGAAVKGGKEGEELLKKVTDLEAQIKELKSQLTYGRADFINLQKRTDAEKLSTKDFAIQGFASDLLSTVDILTLALKHAPNPLPADNPHLSTLHSGVSMTKNELIKTLSRHGVTEFDPIGEKFDPNKHEALFRVPKAVANQARMEGGGKELEEGMVMDVQKTGYMLKGRTLRPAQVGVVGE